MKQQILATLTLTSVLMFSGCVNDEVKSSKVNPDKKMERFQSVAMEKTTMLQTGEAKHDCPECGMKLPMVC